MLLYETLLIMIAHTPNSYATCIAGMFSLTQVRTGSLQLNNFVLSHFVGIVYVFGLVAGRCYV